MSDKKKTWKPLQEEFYPKVEKYEKTLSANLNLFFKRVANIVAIFGLLAFFFYFLQPQNRVGLKMVDIGVIYIKFVGLLVLIFLPIFILMKNRLRRLAKVKACYYQEVTLVDKFVTTSLRRKYNKRFTVQVECEDGSTQVVVAAEELFIKGKIGDKYIGVSKDKEKINYLFEESDMYR